MDRPVTILIVDDDPKARELLEIHLRAIPGTAVTGAAAGADEAYRMLLERVPDIILLDVEMPGKSGFDLLQDIRKLEIRPCIIFQTAFDQYAIRAIKSAAFDYLLKPIDPVELQDAIARYRSSEHRRSLESRIDDLLEHLHRGRKIRLHTHSGFILVDPADIHYCEADWNYTVVHYGQDQSATLSLNLGKLLDLLPAHSFFRISRSIVINLTHLTSVSRKHQTCTLQINGREQSFHIPVKHIQELEGRI